MRLQPDCRPQAGKKYNWTRDLSEKVRKEVTARLVTDQVTAEARGNPLRAKEAIELAATRGVEVVRQYRAGIKSNRSGMGRYHRKPPRQRGPRQ